MAHYIRFYKQGPADIFEIYLHDDEKTLTVTTGNEKSSYHSEDLQFDSSASTAKYLGEKVEEYRAKEWPTVGMVFNREPVNFILTPEQARFYHDVETAFGRKYVFSSDSYLKLPIFLGSANLTYDKIQPFSHFNDYCRSKGWDFNHYVPLGSYIAISEEDMATYQNASASELEEFYSYCPADQQVYRFHHDVGAEAVGSLESFRETLSLSAE